MNNKRRAVIFAFVAVAIAFAATILCIITGNYVKEGYDFAVGKISPAKIVAPRQIENVYATEKKRQEAASSVTASYKLDHNVSDAVLADINDTFDYLEERKRQDDLALAEQNSAAAAPVEAEQHDTAFLITDRQYEYYKIQPRAVRVEFRDAVLSLAESILEQGVRDASDPQILMHAREELIRGAWPEDLRNIGYLIITSSLKPNLVIDEEATQAAATAKTAEVQPVIVLEGQKIVDEGEVITEEIFSLLKSFDLVAGSGEKDIYKLSGSIILVVLVFLIFIFYIGFFYKKLAYSRKVVTLICLLYSLSILMIRLMTEVTFYIIPLSIVAIFVAILVDQRLAFFFNMLFILLCALVYNGNFEFVLFFLTSGFIAILLSRFTFERTKILVVVIAIGIFNFLIVSGINLFYYKSIDRDIMFNAVLAVANGLLSLLIALGSLPILEAVFDIITPIKLLDLTSPTNQLLRRLTIEAPGTYHHSLIVANLSEQAAHDVEANAPLARVGGYYHDIGKLKYPYYFSENQAGENPHDRFDPYDSAKLIMQHVSIGMDLAEAYKLPKVIKDMINQHHGTTLVKFFFNKAQKMYSVDHVKEEDFRYKGPVPKSNEAAIVMLADTAEAAVRSMITGSKSMDEVEEFLKVLIKDKLDDSQLDYCQLTLLDLVTIRKSFMKVFRGMYHERVKYPELEKPAKIEKAESSVIEAVEKFEEKDDDS